MVTEDSVQEIRGYPNGQTCVDCIHVSRTSLCKECLLIFAAFKGKGNSKRTTRRSDQLCHRKGESECKRSHECSWGVTGSSWGQ